MSFRRVGRNLIEITDVDYLGKNRKRVFDIDYKGSVPHIKAQGSEAMQLARSMQQENAAQALLQDKIQQQKPQQSQQMIQTPIKQELILPTKLSSNDLPPEVIEDLYRRSAIQGGAPLTYLHPGQERLHNPANIRMFGSHLAEELLAQELVKSKLAQAHASAEVRKRTPKELNRFSDGGTDIAGLFGDASIDVKTQKEPYYKQQITGPVGNTIIRHRQQSEPEGLLAYYSQGQNKVDVNELKNIEQTMKRFSDKRNPIEFNLVGHITENDFIDNSSFGPIAYVDNPGYTLNKNALHRENQYLIDYLKQRM